MAALSSSQFLDNDILFHLDRFQNGPIKKRIVNEIVEFKKNNAYVHLEFEENYTHFHQSTIKINIVPNEDNNIYSFILSKNYPFTPPIKFCINYKDYKQYLKVDSPKTMNELRIYNDIKCFCCSSIYCSGNWSPGLKMQNMMNEFKQIKKYRRDIINRLLAKKIVDKYLIPDLNIILNEWLL